MKKRATIKDIAQIAKISSTAVSMALNHRPGVSSRTREKVLSIATELGYQPNYAAKSLISRQSNTLALIVHNIADPFYAELALGVEGEAARLGYSLLIYNTGTSPRIEERERDLISNLRARGVDGVILSTVSLDDPNIELLVEDRFPFVLVNRLSLDPKLQTKMDFVVLDNLSCGYKGTEHLYRMGHDTIAVIAGALNASTASLRTRGSVQAMKDLGMNRDPKWVVECHYIREEAYRAAKRILSAQNCPSAFFAQDDNMALGVREAILEIDLRIPQDISLLGVDNTPVTALTGIELTTITQHIRQMGITGAKTLINKIEMNNPHMVNQIIMEPEIVIRKSCGFYPKGYVR